MPSLRQPQNVCGLFFLLAAATLLPTAAAGQGFIKESWNLAVVVEQSAMMDQPWLGTSRRLAAQKALGLELRTLPLRITAGLWLGSAQGAEPLVKPRPAQGLKALTLSLPPGQGRPALLPGLEAATGWLHSQGGGAILLLSSGAGLEPPELKKLAWDQKKIFCHVVSLALNASQPDLENLALQGSGAFFPVQKPAKLNYLLHQAVRLALSPAQLLVLTHDYANRPLKIQFGLTRTNQVAVRRRGFSGHPLQVLPAVYKLHFPSLSELGPGDPPASASVGKSGVTRIWFGGKGVLKVESRGKDGKELAWAMSVSRQGEGEMMASLRKTPFDLTLPADFYLVNSQRPPLGWMVEVGAGKTVNLVVGPPGSLKVDLKGAAGPLRVPFQALNLLGAGKNTFPGYTGSPLRLLPGPYQLEIDLVPPLTRRVEMKPGAQMNLELPAVGELLLTPKGPGSALSFEVYTLKDQFLASGLSGRGLPLRAGTYQLRFGKNLSPQKVSITAGQLTTLKPPTP